jgi:hypothetical protein
MTLNGTMENVIGHYLTGVPDAGEAPHYFDQVLQETDSSTLVSGLSEMLRSDETPAFGQLVEQMFRTGTSEQRAAILSALIGNLVTPQRAMATSPQIAAQLAVQAERHAPSVVERIATVLAVNPTLVKALGPDVLAVTLREVAGRYPIG